jgi:predicted phage tail protein
VITVLLYGHLAKAFGRRHRFDIRTPAEAIRALCANFPGFQKHLVAHNQTGYRIVTGEQDRDVKDLHDPAFANTIKIVPIVAGAGGDFGQIILGGALIAASFVPGLQGPMFIEGLGGEMFGAMSLASIAGNIGFSLVLGGLSNMLMSAPTPQQGASERPENKPSYAFDGAVNTTAQGNPVPICYGEMIVGSQVISTGLSTEQI